MLDLKEIARHLRSDVANLRRSLHAIPEPRWQEMQTMAMIISEVDLANQNFPSPNIQVDCKKDLRGGLVVDVTVNPELPRVLLRADIDALPITEETGLSFASTNDGYMHACGHDANSAMLLVAFRAILAEKDFPFAHNLRFVWQRAEENPVTCSGGDVLVNYEGVCDGISAAYALHLITDTPSCTFSSRGGALLGNSGRLGMTIRTSGGHVAEPHQGADALRVVQAVMNAMDQLGATILPPTEPRVLEPVIVKAGSASNVRPSEASVWYAARSMLPRVEHFQFMKDVEAAVSHVVSGFSSATVEFDRVLGHPATINSPNHVQRLAETLMANDRMYCDHPPMLGGEDFAYYLQKVPGAMFMLGAGRERCGPIHSPTFNPDESVLWRGVHFWLLVASNPV